MPVIAVEITKRGQYLGSPEEWANVYHYFFGFLDPVDDVGLIRELTNIEKDVHNGDIEFVRGRTWGPTDGPAFDNVIRETVDLEGVGEAGPGTAIHRAAVVVVRWDLPRSPTTNRRRWLRKYLHVGALPGSAPSTASSGHTQIPEAQRARFEEYAEAVENAGNAFDADSELCTQNGDRRINNTGRVMPYVTIHDLKY